ncbi:hypothetical protein COS16_00050 [Candidatus Desantisbacteria bacterium CG02_land_8_20_14_3_00_49_13]|nr:MAG: hypothetical protein COS16_00050 [Candidatus Desantisbacteria bacterium CG02_land_8_20_14_3_00_49_13]
MTEGGRILIVAEGDARSHDFHKTGVILRDILKEDEGFDAELVERMDAITPEKLGSFKACIFYAHGPVEGYSRGKLTAEQESLLMSFVKKGGGFVGIHCASIFKGNKNYLAMLGCEFKGHAPYQEFQVNIADRDSLVTKRLQDFSVSDELYFVDHDPAVHILATAFWQGKSQPMVYIKECGKGKVCYVALGHDGAALLHPSFRKIVGRAARFVTGFREDKTVSGAVIGYGGAFNMGKAHLDMMNAAGIKGIGACDLNARRMEAVKKDFPAITTYTDYKKMLKNKEIGLVSVITPHNTHAPIAMDCLAAGKSVVLEKPMCLTTKEATEMIRAAKKNGVMLSVFHNRRWDGDFLAIEEVVKKGMIGNIFHTEIFIGGYGHPGYWWRSDKKISGGALYDWGAHLIFWTLGLIPSGIKNVTGFFHKRVWHSVTVEDQTQAIIRFENGAYADIQVSSIAAIGKPRWRILGETGGITDEWGKGSFHMSSLIQGVRSESDIKYKPSFWNEYYVNVADHLMLGEKLEITAEKARRVIGVIEAAEKSSKTGEPAVVPYE